MIYLKYIIQGWINYFLDIISDLKYKKYFESRMEICKKCEFKEGLFCGKCGCVLAAKTKSEDSSCPINKWDTISNTLNKYKNE